MKGSNRDGFSTTGRQKRKGSAILNNRNGSMNHVTLRSRRFEEKTSTAAAIANMWTSAVRKNSVVNTKPCAGLSPPTNWEVAAKAWFAICAGQ